MAGTWRISFSAMTVIIVLVSSANAFHGRMGQWFGGSSSSSTYPPPPIYYYCPPMASMVVPAPQAYPKLAVPTPAPPSSSVEPPLGSTLPKITTLSGALAKDRCRVGFWNLAGKDVTVMIEGKSWSLPRNQVLTFEMQRQFTWQIPGQPQHVERVAQGESAHEVLIRE